MKSDSVQRDSDNITTKLPADAVHEILLSQFSLNKDV